ncbi:U3 small nucleolar RNA-associated protein 14 like protein A [Tupaia chinensis]|uniref:U3 small nucleolar RNA-associated protein 14 like protein A n=1 Tax=Tupaia chinensis TaxID=246437 RepID=L9LDK0_TUPCH|nr:U3 small nucleolar RNA-associated protein 14 like protein A [Tupaia chinensis]
MLRSCTIVTKEGEFHKDPKQLPEPVSSKVSESEGDERPVAEEEILLKEFEERRSLRKTSELHQDAELVSSQETKDSSSQEVLSELKSLSRKLNKQKHKVRKPKVSSVETVLQLQKEAPGPEEEEPLLLQGPERAQMVEELEEQGKEGCSLDKELPRPVSGGQRNLPNVIINEKHNIHATAHEVRVLPYPFTHHQQFERTLQTPIGTIWNTQRAFQKLTTPKVITKPGHIIKPIKAEDVGYQRPLYHTEDAKTALLASQKKQLKKNSVKKLLEE